MWYAIPAEHSHDHALDVKVSRIFGVQHVAGNIRAIGTCITFAVDIDAVAVHAKGIDKVFPKAHKLLGDIVFIFCGYVSSGEACVHGLLNPDDIGKMMPAPRILVRTGDSNRPNKGAVFLQQTTKRRAARLVWC